MSIRPIERAQQAVWSASFYNLLFLGSVGIVFVLFDETIVRMFSPDPEVIHYGSNARRRHAYADPH